MNKQPVNIHIGEIVLEGFSASQRTLLEGSIKTELTVLIQKHGLPEKNTALSAVISPAPHKTATGIAKAIYSRLAVEK